MRTLASADFKALVDSGATLLDVRLPEELEIAALPGAVNIPLNDLPDRIGELNPAAPIAVLCHHGVRSERAARFLERSGFVDVSHLEGGIDAWSLEFDPAVPRY
ncbi:Rhodanese-related sulfurtransferase [Hydrocarboniphaga daqingensis]|jgi:rhodanese-related sulfurtransferase|uniref:Rhodanese-related sulfurtransferase n=1 Tax=Hydrocarboniphaga daqingensis TaxID=490188 RepID=A0A1M5QPU2_9GAMM|nr:rhodanese-like domain-containing protein [Hydrocarboniphaga daqingensis]SHH16147.1 Rhodanese-related sulfurtransferase [Hydrocarboniphaga daqingensis]